MCRSEDFSRKKAEKSEARKKRRTGAGVEKFFELEAALSGR
jgi:hypothetical protein